MASAILPAGLKALAGAALLAPALLLGGSALAQGNNPSAVTQPSAAGKPPAQVAPQAITAEVTGFRSARFGMSEEQVREAIKRDFDIDAKDVKKLRNEVQKTDIIGVQVDDLVPGSGTSLVFYIFGYSSKRLIHVNVVWGRLAQQTTPPASLVNTGAILQGYFKNLGLAAGPTPSTTAQVTLFQGADEKKRTIQLVIELAPVAPEKKPQAAAPAKPADPKAARPAQPAASAQQPAADKAGDTQQFVATSLRLSYVESMSNPDIYTVPKGKF
jgi:hypothetical protein